MLITTETRERSHVNDRYDKAYNFTIITVISVISHSTSLRLRAKLITVHTDTK